MPKEEQPKERVITLHSPGTLPGIPGQHGPGDYLVNYAERTIRLLPLENEVPEEPSAKQTRLAKPTQGIEQAD